GAGYFLQGKMLVWELRRLARQLENRPTRGYLSAETVIDKQLDQLQRALDELRQDELASRPSLPKP
ncbi:MAG TPA: hypothetical protein VHF69_09375, partial [Candidatus Synoicihabitans sp.]|nr:hypothetical protein [Candidatus Synoicihabitans sp.]